MEPVDHPDHLESFQIGERLLVVLPGVEDDLPLGARRSRPRLPGSMVAIGVGSADDADGVEGERGSFHGAIYAGGRGERSYPVCGGAIISTPKKDVDKRIRELKAERGSDSKRGAKRKRYT